MFQKYVCEVGTLQGNVEVIEVFASSYDAAYDEAVSITKEVYEQDAEDIAVWLSTAYYGD